jgi:hypothetical protein
MQIHKDDERRRWYLEANDERVADALTVLREEPS